MNIQNKNENTFDGTINISSNIKDNKNTIIGKFDLKDIFFILIAGFIGILILSFMLVVLSIRNMFLIFIVLAIFEVPIVTLGFFDIYNMPIIDYIKMKSKSDNRPYRKQIYKKKTIKEDKYVFTICFDNIFSKLEQVINDLYSFIPNTGLEIKFLFDRLFLTIEVENLTEIIYDKLFDYLKINKDIKYISVNDINNYETYIKSLKFPNKIYGKKQNKEISDLKSKLQKLKKNDEINPRYEYLTNKIVDIKDNKFIKVYKFKLYKAPLDLRVFDELKDICSITIHTVNNSDKLVDLSFVNTFIDITDTMARETRPYCIGANAGIIGANADIVGANADIVGASTTNPCMGELNEPQDKEKKVKQILEKYHILYKEISEEKVKDSLLFLLENRY